MKKNLFLFVIAMSIVFGSFAQQKIRSSHGERSEFTRDHAQSPIPWDRTSREAVFSEDFSNNGFDNWTVVGDGIDNWYSSESNSAGGAPPEAVMNYNPIFDGTSRLVSPVINTSGNTGLTLSFLHLIDSYVGEFTVSVETTSDGGTTWNEAWRLYWESPENYSAFEVIDITSADVGSENFQFCFRFVGNTDLMDNWIIDNITLGEPIAYDVTPSSISGLDAILYIGDEVNVSSVIKSYGSETATFDVTLDIDNGSEIVFTSTVQVTDLAFLEADTVTFESWTAPLGQFTATVTTKLAGDEVPENDQINMYFPVFDPDSYCVPGGDCSWGDGFQDFAFAGIDNLGSGCSFRGYGIFTDLKGSVEIGQTYTATMSSGYSNNWVSIWIDFNKDLVFEDHERILTDYEITAAFELLEVDVLIPGNGIPGTTTMRIGSAYGALSSPDPCAWFTYGEFEDYTIEVTGTSINKDAVAMSIDLYHVLEKGDIIPKATVTNNGIETISFPVTCEVAGTGYSSTKQVTDLPIGGEVQLEFDTWTAVPGAYDMMATTALEGDEIPGNDMVSKNISVLDFIPAKSVVGEEGTGTWCGWCTRGLVYMDSLKMKYPDTWIGIAVHNGDPMLVEEYDAGIGPLIGFAYPGGLVDRAISTDPSYFEAAYLERMNIPPVAALSIDNRVYNWDTRELTFTVTAEFVVSVSDYRLNAALVENHVTGTGDGWAQANYYSGGGSGPMGGMEDLPNPIPAEDMIYDDVARAILGGFAGLEESLPATVAAGETHSYDFSIQIALDWDVTQLEIVGMLINNADGAIDNGVKEHLLVTGIPETRSLEDALVYPNPATNQVTVKLSDKINTISVYDYTGSMIQEDQVNASTHTINTSRLSSGVYLLRITTDTGVAVKQVIIK